MGTPPARDVSNGLGGRRATLRRAVIMGAVAFVLYGGWALWANREHGLSASLTAALTQGGVTFGLGVTSATLLELFFRVGKRPWTRMAWAFGGTGTVALTGLISAHVIMGTPEILITILPATLVSIPYYIAYSLYLLRVQRPVPDLDPLGSQDGPGYIPPPDRAERDHGEPPNRRSSD